MLQRNHQGPKFRVFCLGCFRLVDAIGGADITPASRKTRALIGYLCIVGKPVGRERLASLLWGDRGDEQARASLRQAIYELRSVPGGDRLLRADRDTVEVGEEVSTDLALITAAAQSGDLEQLIHWLSECRGDLLEDLPSIDPSFDAWLQSERLRVQEALVEAAVEAARAGMARGEIALARKVSNLLQQRDNTNEVVLRLSLRLDCLAGDTAALHRRYERFSELLKAELNAAPAMETQKLFQEMAAVTSAQAPTGAPRSSRIGDANERVDRDDTQGAAAPAQKVLPPGSTQTEPDARSSTRRFRYRIGAASAASAIAIGALVFAVWYSWHTTSRREKPVLVVMAFQNLSGDPDARSFSDGFAADVANALAGEADLHVVSTRVEPNIRYTFAPRTLAATHVLGGSVERVGRRIHVIAQLMDIAGDHVVWSHAYDNAISQTSARKEIAARIAGTVGAVLSSASPGEARHVNEEAYAHYLKGRAFFRERNPYAAARELDQSIRLAPNFAEAWSTLAADRWLLARVAIIGRGGHYDPKLATAAKAAAERALALDPRNGQALGVLALLTPSAHLQEMDQLLERALRFEPHNPELLGWHGQFLMFVGRNHEALDELTRAYELDSATPRVTSSLVLACLKTGHFEEAREIINLIDRSRPGELRDEFLHLKIEYFLYMRDWFHLANYLRVLPSGLSPRMVDFLRLCHETAIALGTREVDKYAALRARWRTETSVDPDDAVQFLFVLGDADGALQVVRSAVKIGRNDEFLTDPEWEVLFDADLVPMRRDARVPALFVDWGLLNYWQAANHWPDFIR